MYEVAIRKYETGYKSEFWELETDLLYNYQFYFLNLNPNRLTGIPIEELDKNKKEANHERKKYSSKNIVDDITSNNSFAIDDS
jgi:hypothetical protein